MLRFAFSFLLCLLPALGERAVVEVVRVEDVVPVLSALMNAAHIDLSATNLADILPTGNLQGTLASGLNMVAGAIRAPLAPEQAIGSVIKEIEAVPIVGGKINTLMGQLQSPEIPTLPPSSLPADLERAVRDFVVHKLRHYLVYYINVCEFRSLIWGL